MGKTDKTLIFFLDFAVFQVFRFFFLVEVALFVIKTMFRALTLSRQTSLGERERENALPGHLAFARRN